MTLLNAPEYDARREDRKRNLLVGSGVVVLVAALVAVAGFLTGHGWFFSNLPVEHRVNVFLTTVEQAITPRRMGCGTTIRTGSSIRRSMTTRCSGLPRTGRRRATGVARSRASMWTSPSGTTP